MEKVLDKFTIRWFVATAVAFVALICYGVYIENFYVMVMPIALIIIYAAFFHLEKLMLFAVFCTPLSMNIEEFGAEDIGLHLPTEPILFGILVVFLIRNFHKSMIDKKFLMHPVTIAVIVYLVWMMLSCVTSENPIISWKYYLARLWFIVPLFFFGVIVFKQAANIKRFIWIYMLPLVGVAIYTLVRHAMHNFDEESGHWVMSPFFKDHTSYGAILAMFYPAAIAFLFYKKYSMAMKVTLFTIVTILTVALIYSYTRAAWVSLAGALAVYAAMKFKIKFSYIATGVVAASALLLLNWEQTQIGLERNKSEHATEDFGERLESMSNISSDASNLERLNLWECALAMAEARPVMGWGPGTFQFNYGQFQHYQSLTIISQKSGRDVNAHSEYFGPLAESGIMGMLSILFVVCMIVWRGIVTYLRLPPGEMRMLTLVVLLGLITYFTHGVLNNYMDTDKASVPIWGFAAILVAVDLYHAKAKVPADAQEEDSVES
jgi:putative inorganic carbon (HCO3(-)) transporter